MSHRSGTEGAKPKVEFPNDLFTSLQRGDVHEATLCLRAASITESGEASPTAKKLMESGEWDLKDLLSLVYIDGTKVCPGRVGTDGLRFCGKLMTYCNAAGHPKNTVGPITRGWYISFGKSLGVLLSPFLPAHEDGGPIDAATASQLTGLKPFRLTRGQWKFVIDAWHSLRVETLSEPSTDDESKEGSKTTSHAKPPPLKTNAEDIEDLESKLNEQQSETTKQHDRLQLLQTILKDVQDKNRKLEEQVQRNELQMRSFEAVLRNVQNRNETQTDKYVEEIRRLKDQIETLEDRLYAMPSGDGLHEGGFNNQALLDKVEILDNAMFSATGVIGRFKDSFIEFKDQFESGGGVELKSVSFKSYHEFMAWFNKYKPSVDVFLDGLAYMHAIRAPVVHSDDATKQRELQMKTAFATALEATVVTSFDTILPSILVGGKKSDSSQGTAFDWLASYLKSYEVWKPTGTNHGVAHQITNGVNSVTKRVAELRRQYDEHRIVLLSNELCHDSANFCHEFVRFINDQQEELTNNTAYTEEQVWQMQLECIQKIVEELSEAREAFGDVGKSERGNLVWGMLMSWKVQQRYLANHFKDDPALTGVLVRRILMQGQDQSVKKKMAKIDALEAKVAETKNYTTSEIGKVKAEVTKVKEEISKLKK